eukprot:scaffold193327_cov13-Tisochrysis_lutea.AAC.1
MSAGSSSLSSQLSSASQSTAGSLGRSASEDSSRSWASPAQVGGGCMCSGRLLLFLLIMHIMLHQSVLWASQEQALHYVCAVGLPPAQFGGGCTRTCEAFFPKEAFLVGPLGFDRLQRE